MVPDIALNDGTTIPQLGFGTLQIPESRQPSEAEIAEAAGVFGQAFAIGYRHFDTAQSYGNEKAVGRPWPSRAWPAATCSSPAS